MHISAGISQTTVSGTFYCIGQRGEEFKLLRHILLCIEKDGCKLLQCKHIFAIKSAIQTSQ